MMSPIGSLNLLMGTKKLTSVLEGKIMRFSLLGTFLGRISTILFLSTSGSTLILILTFSGMILTPFIGRIFVCIVVLQ